MTVELAASPGVGAECGCVEVEYVDPDRGPRAQAPNCVLVRGLASFRGQRNWPGWWWFSGRASVQWPGVWETAGVVFVADALGGWLVGQLADAGRKKLTELVLGSEQERALRRAADVAVWATAEEVSPSGGEQAGQVAMVISEVFRDPVPDAPLAGAGDAAGGTASGDSRAVGCAR
jgi:hypothetical protein